MRIMVRRQRVSGGRSQTREIPGRDRSGSWEPDVRHRNERSLYTEYKDGTSGQKIPGSVVIRMDRRIIRRCPGAATEDQRCSGRKRRRPGTVSAERT